MNPLPAIILLLLIFFVTHKVHHVSVYTPYLHSSPTISAVFFLLLVPQFLTTASKALSLTHPVRQVASDGIAPYWLWAA